MKFIEETTGFRLEHNGNIILEHSIKNPLIYIGEGKETVDMYRGNFKIDDHVYERIGLRDCTIQDSENEIVITFPNQIKLTMNIESEKVIINLEELREGINRFWIRLVANEDERVYGLGEQMSHFNLRGKNFPIWTSEPGVGRNKSTYVTWRSDVENKAGGDYYNTNYPEPTFVSDQKYFFHVDSTAYADFNFRNDNFHEVEVWEVPKVIHIEAADNFMLLLEKITALFGRQPLLPEWVYNGLIIGTQGGTKRSFGILDKAREKGIQVSGLWCQDWEGKKVTSFGKRLKWDWKWDEEMYPDLPEKMKKIKAEGVRFLGYINPYLLVGTDLYNEAYNKGYFATTIDDGEYLVDFGEFDCGVVDFTNPDAFTWYKELIKKNLIEFGLDGWMADFGEYLPTDLKLFSGEDPMIAHNRWPVLWAKCNYEALEETGKLEEILYFMRAGGNGSQKYCTLLWVGDQSVDFSLDDGLASVISGTLSAGMVGNGLNHSDIGGYTSLFDNVRTKELFLRWAEMATFTPVMRTHEGNRPEENFQFYDDEDTMEQLAKLTNVYKTLSPYLKEAVRENHERGIPVQRPLFIHYENEEETYDIQTEYLFGRDVLVAPIYLEGVTSREVYFPNEKWVHLFTGETYNKGIHTVNAPMGVPAAFYREGSKWEDLFKKIRNL